MVETSFVENLKLLVHFCRLLEIYFKQISKLIFVKFKELLAGMPELIAQVAIPRHVRVGGIVEWSSQNRCLLATAEGVVIVEFILPAQNTLSIKCDSIPLKTEIVEPQFLDRQSLISKILSNNDKLQHMKLDKVVCPSLRSMGDVLAVKQARWEPPGDTTFQRLAVHAQKLLIYSLVDSEWHQTLDISEFIACHLRRHALEQSSGETREEVEELFDLHSQHVQLFTWTQSHRNTSGGTYSHMVVSNSYDHLMALKLDSDSSEPVIQQLVLPDVVTSKISSLSWVSVDKDTGFLVIGRQNGTCALVGLSAHLDIMSTKELFLDADYRAVELPIQNMKNELLFFKYNQVYLYNATTDIMQSFLITETKYNLNQAAITNTHVYVTTVDAGFVIKSRDTGETTYTIPEQCQWTSHGASLSPSGVFLFTVSEPNSSDSYVYPKPVLLRLYELQNIESYTKEIWNSGNISWDSFLMVGHHMGSLPDWLMQVVEDPQRWMALSLSQLRLLYVVLHCQLDRRHPSASSASAQRIKDLAYLKLMLSVACMKLAASTRPDTLSYISLWEQLLSNFSVDGAFSSLPKTTCQICDGVLALSADLQYNCADEHAASVCCNTMAAIQCPNVARCTQCEAPTASLNDLTELQRNLLQQQCSYCGGSLAPETVI